MKNAAKSFTVQRDYVERLFVEAARQGKNARLVITFPNLTVECTITRDLDPRT